MAYCSQGLLATAMYIYVTNNYAKQEHRPMGGVLLYIFTITSDQQ
jgi:hypothetical protein